MEFVYLSGLACKQIFNLSPWAQMCMAKYFLIQGFRFLMQIKLFDLKQIFVKYFSDPSGSGMPQSLWVNDKAIRCE